MSDLTSILATYPTNSENALAQLHTWAAFSAAQSGAQFDVAARELYASLPLLLKTLFKNDKPAVAAPRLAAQLELLLAPNAPLLLVLARADQTLKYVVEPETLGLPARTLLNRGCDAASLLPLVYKDRIAPQHQPKLNDKDPVPSRVALNMFEFFFFSFSLVAVHLTPEIDPRPRTQPAKSHAGLSSPIHINLQRPSEYLHPRQSQQLSQSSIPPPPPSTLPLPKLSTPLLRFTNLSDVYFKLLQAYLHFYVPLEKPSSATVSAQNASVPTADTSNDPSALRRRLAAGAGVVGSIKTGLMSHHSHSSDFPSAAAAGSSSGRSIDRISILNSPELSHLDVNVKIGISQFVVAILVDLWLCQNEYIETARNGGKYTRPTAIQLQCVQILVNHISDLDLKSMFSQSLASTQAFQRGHQYQQQQMNQQVSVLSRAHSEIVMKSFESLQKPLYYFLRLAIKFAETDEYFPIIVDIWMSYITPWRNSEKMTVTAAGSRTSSLHEVQVSVKNDWVPFITQNFLFYSRLLRNFMERAVSFDLFAATRPADLTNPTSSFTAAALSRPMIASVHSTTTTTTVVNPTLNRSKSLHLCLDRVMNTYRGTNGLLDVLKCLDAILVGCEMPVSASLLADAASPLGMSTPTRSATSPVVRMRGRTNSGGVVTGSVSGGGGGVEWIDKMGGVDALGMWVRNRIMDLEGRIDYQSVFMGMVERNGEAPGIVLAKTMLGNIYSTINRLNTYLPVNLPLQKPNNHSPPKGNTSPLTTVAPTLPLAATNAFPTFPKDRSFVPISVYIWAVLSYMAMSVYVFFASNLRTDKTRQERRTGLLQNAVAQLYALAKVCVHVFGVSESDRAAIESSVVGAAGSGDWMDEFGYGDEGESEEACSDEMFPGVATPEVLRKDMLRVTESGRQQIKLGVRKSDPRNVPVRRTKRVEGMVMSYEFEWVVK
ncbi:sphingomyelin phosphodiesterase 4, neutral membrane (neutral sphingomyelinase-3), partial [Podochytrium sp. JEL0797]